MIIDDQTELIGFLSDPATYGGRGAVVERIETHISEIFLVGDRAFKAKRAVRLPYADFSTAALRLADCEKELVLNRRTAPMLYKAVRRITRAADGRLDFDGPGPLVDAVVEMVRFDEAALFDRMAARGALTPALLTRLAETIARFHATAVVDHARSGSARIADVLDINENAFGQSRIFDPQALARLNTGFRDSLACHAPLLDARERAGKVRRCHGDLHLGNICLVDGTPTLFDCIEFNDAIATIDILYDVAFLITDLWSRGLGTGANLVFNRYFDAREETDGLPLVAFFMALRAAVRAHVAATRAQDAARSHGEALDEAHAHFALAQKLLEPAPPRLVAIGGLSGSGKSTFASLLADRIGRPPGARILSSDRIRKQLHGVAAQARLPQSAYRSEVSEKVYGLLASGAAEALRLGQSVVADAVFNRPADREAIASVAAKAEVRFDGLWLEAPADLMLQRVGRRCNDPSDATAEVLRAQLAVDPGAIGWSKIDSSALGPALAARTADALQ